MVWIPSGTGVQGSDDDRALPEERPAHALHVSGFWIDRHEVTNAEFARFVRATGYVTTSELPTPLERIMLQLPPGSPEPDPSALVAASAVFIMPDPQLGVPGGWDYVQGADWRHPEGPGSSIEARGNHPVVQVSWWDAMAYAAWAGKQLPTEAQWEWAARGGLLDAPYVWGFEPPDREHPPLNMWQGTFPQFNAAKDGYLATAPVESYAPNGYGLYDMAGNVWEWCADAFDPHAYRGLANQPALEDPFQAPIDAQDLAPRSLRGGSFLCSDNFCTRYRPSARTGNTPDSATNHTGFRCVKTSGPEPSRK